MKVEDWFDRWASEHPWWGFAVGCALMGVAGALGMMVVVLVQMALQ